jgi:hypothetical protein
VSILKNFFFSFLMWNRLSDCYNRNYHCQQWREWFFLVGLNASKCRVKFLCPSN